MFFNRGRRRPNKPTDPRQDEIHRLAKRVVNIHGDQWGNFSNGALIIRYTEANGVYVAVPTGSWENSVVYHWERDLDREKKALNREFEQLGIGMKGGAKYYTVTTYESEHADRVITLMNQLLVLDELSRVLEEDDAEDS
jgi:hypothetical protein